MRVAAGSIIAGALALAVLNGSPVAFATTINGITFTNAGISAENRGINDVGLSAGFNLFFGGNISDPSGTDIGYSSAGIFTPGVGSTAAPRTQTLSPCSSPANNVSLCTRITPFNNAGLTNGTWAYEIQNQIGTTATFALPSAATIPTTPVPFPSSVTIANSANGVNPTISWTLPAGLAPNAFAILIFDRSNSDVVVHSASILPTATSYTVPSILSVGTNQSLIVGHNYTINFQEVTTRDGTANTSNANLLTRNLSYFDFTPLLGSTTPTNIQLPMVDTTGVYHFNVGSVGPSSITFIDPAIAVGYIYDIGASDPNFASVLLPDVGGGVFDLSYGSTSVVLDAGVQYFFPTGGESEFTVTGIDPSADLDPANTSAFITGLTFESPGSFTGTMTPITENTSAVPEPTSLTLLVSGLLGFGLVRRQRKAS
jgi:hypothetical protein